MKENVLKLVELGKIPDDSHMSDELFDQYDQLIQMDEPLTFEEAEAVVSLFSDDCYDLNWGLLHLKESVGFSDDIQRYRSLISRCNNHEF